MQVYFSSEKQLDKDEFQEDGSMAAFWVVNNQFHKFIDSKFTLDYDSQMRDKYFVEYTRIKVKHFRDTLLQHMGNVKKSVAERTCHKRQYDRRVNKRQMQTQESKIDTGKPVDADLVVTKSSGQNQKSEESNRQQHTEQPEIINKGRVDQYTEQCQVKSPMLDSSFDNPTLNISLILHEFKQTETLDVSAGTSINVQKEQSLDLSASTLCNVNKENIRVWLLKKLISQYQRDPQCDSLNDELQWRQSRSSSSVPRLQCSTTVLEQDSLSPGPQSQENVP
ncbi:hypothetical protein Tco_1384965 [Tanacetum coccineum]